MNYTAKTEPATFLYKIHRDMEPTKRLLADDCAVDRGILTVYRIIEIDGAPKTVAIYVCPWTDTMVIEACDPQTELPIADYGCDALS